MSGGLEKYGLSCFIEPLLNLTDQTPISMLICSVLNSKNDSVDKPIFLLDVSNCWRICWLNFTEDFLSVRAIANTFKVT